MRIARRRVCGAPNSSVCRTPHVLWYPKSLRQHFDDIEIETLRREHAQDPNYFAARVRAAAGLLKERP